MGVTVGEAEIRPDQELAINPGQVYGMIDGERTRDPAFGLDAVWIREDQREHAQALGYTVVDSSLCSPLILVNCLPTMRHS